MAAIPARAKWLWIGQAKLGGLCRGTPDFFGESINPANSGVFGATEVCRRTAAACDNLCDLT